MDPMVVSLRLRLCSVSIGVGWCLGVSDLKGSSPRPTTQRNVPFILDLITLDPLQNNVTLDWWVVGDDCIAGNASNAESALPCPVVNIYVNSVRIFDTVFSVECAQRLD